MSTVSFGIKADGLEETLAAFARWREVLRPEMQRTLHEIGTETRDIARMIAQSEGLDGAGKYTHSRDPHPGALIAKIRVNASDRRVSITEYSRSHSARYPSYPYPRRYEYGDRRHPFMRPAVDAEQPLLELHFAAMLERVRLLSDLHD